MKKKTALLCVAAFLLAVACQGSSLGNACTTDSDCEKGESCFDATRGFPGGFCTKGCTREGVSTECPSGDLCTRTTAANYTLFCSPPCNDDSGCRGGSYSCRAVTGSTQKACAP